MTPSRVAGSLRYFLARVQLHDAQGLPERLALTSALVGEGVTYVTRSLAAATDVPWRFIHVRRLLSMIDRDGKPRDYYAHLSEDAEAAALSPAAR